MEMNDLKSNYLIDKLMKFPTHPNNKTGVFFLKEELNWRCVLVEASILYFMYIYLYNVRVEL